MSRSTWARSVKRRVSGTIVIAGLLVATQASAYRTVSDLAEFAGAGKIAWQSTEVPLLISDASDGPLTTAGVDSVLEDTSWSWSQVGCNEPRLTISGHTYAPASPGDGVNSVQWVKSNWAAYGFAPDAAAMTDVQFQEMPAGGWEIVEADLYLNAQGFVWSYDASQTEGTQSLDAVLLHELGHVLGLLHPCEVIVGGGAPICTSESVHDQSVMFPTYQNGNLRLGADDVAGICHLYPNTSAVSCPLEGCPESTICASGGCVAACGGKLCTNDEICIGDVCTRKVPSADVEAECRGRNAGTCASADVGRGQLWDPCVADKDCDAGLLCTDDGYCSRYCTDNSHCEVLGVCGEDQWCNPVAGVFAEACSAAEDCTSSICVRPESGAATCTRACNMHAADCPNTYDCRDTDGRGPICIPATDISGSGCRMVGGASRSNRRDVFWLLLSGLAFSGRRRSNQKRSRFLYPTTKVSNV